MILYRTARHRRHAFAPGGFWTPSKKYARLIHEDWPLFVVKLSPRARRKHFPAYISASRDAIEGTVNEYDVIIFRAWDFPTTEYVVLNPRVLTEVACFE